MYIKSYLCPRLEELGIELDQEQYNKIVKYYELLIEWNKKMNLTTITDLEDFLEKHFIDSILILKKFDMKDTKNIIDIGTGAGFPGIPLKIVYPNLNVTLVDSLAKRIKFLDEVIERLELENIEAIHARAEELGRDYDYRQKFDLCLSRAVSKLPVLSEYCLPFVKIGGMFIAYKSLDTEEEIQSSKFAINKLGCKIKNVYDIKLNNETIRKFVMIERIEKLNKKYPRKAGTPAKSPLILK